MVVAIKQDSMYASANISVVGITKYSGEPQVVLVNSDGGSNSGLKFPGARFRAPVGSKT